MKFPFFKSFLLAGALLLAWNCSDDTIVLPASTVSMYEDARMFSSDDGVLFILSDGTVIDGSGQTVGHLEGNVIIGLDEQPYIEVPPEEELDSVRIAKNSEGAPLIVTNDGEVLDAEGNKIGTVNDDGDIVNDEGEVILEHLDPQNTDPDSGNGENQQQNGKPASSTSNSNNNSNQTGNSSASNGNQTGTSSASNGNNNTPTSVSSVTDGNITYTDNLTQTVSKGSDVSPIVFKGVDQYPQRSWNLYFLQTNFDSENKTATLSGKVPEEFAEKTYTDEITVGGKKYTISITITAGSGGQTGTSSAQHQTTQSSSAKQPTVSSSSAVAYSSTVVSGSCPTIRKKDGGVSGNAWGSQYWDCCKPHCSWTGNVNKSIFDKPAKLCDINGNEVSPNDGQSSGCGGGPHYTCLSQAPREICSGLSIGLAAGDGSWAQKCGTCLRLTFTGEGEGGKRYNIMGKQMIVMISNIGYDVKGDQFDLMIPGGGVGAFDGCSKQWGVSNDQSVMGAQYGGLRAACNNDVNCLKQKCQALFGSKPSLSDGLKGCLWYAEFLEGADNPRFSYEEVECPQELINIYASTK